MFRSALQLREGSKVHFSGTFFKSEADCLKEGSVTLAGSILDPGFIFRFSKIAPIKN
jgi:hypothetical protein